jgi:hypothetical protein
MTCDWGDCDEPAAGWRMWIPLGGWHRPIWLPVCVKHSPVELVLYA